MDLNIQIDTKNISNKQLRSLINIFVGGDFPLSSPTSFSGVIGNTPCRVIGSSPI